METAPSRESPPKDISKEFLEMDTDNFRKFLRGLKSEPEISITIDWAGVPTARRLKAFLEDFQTRGDGQKRYATIVATEEEYKQELNVFASGVKWERKE